MVVGFACDHAAVRLKDLLVEYVRKDIGEDVVDFGAHEGQRVDYTDKAAELCHAVLDGRVERGILLCGTGIGISIAANKIEGMRCALCHDHYTAKMCREHNDANVLALGGRTTGDEVAKDMVFAFLSTHFAGGRHTARVEKIAALDRRC